jgi:hypothetical protein
MLTTVFQKQAKPTDIDTAFESGVEFIEATQTVLRDVQKEKAKLRMGSWCDTDSVIDTAIATKRKPHTVRQVMHTCGTSACVIGWCASHPLFLEKGLYLNRVGVPFLLCEDDSVEAFSLEDPRTSMRYSKLSSSWRIALFGPTSNTRTSAIYCALDIPISKKCKDLPPFFTSFCADIDDYLEASQWVLSNHRDKL